MNRFIRPSRQQANTPGSSRIDFAAAKKPVLLDPGLYRSPRDSRADICSTSGRASSAITRASRSRRPASCVGVAEDVVRISSRQDAQARAAGDVAAACSPRARPNSVPAQRFLATPGRPHRPHRARREASTTIDAGLDALPLEGEAAQEAPPPEPRRSDPVEPAQVSDAKT